MIGRLLNEQLRLSPPEYPLGNCLPLLQATDINIANLETTLTTSEDAVSKTFNFKSDPKHVRSLVAGKLGFVNLANNHIFDYSLKGFQETLHTLKQAGIHYVGAGFNLEEACAPLYITKEQITCGLLGATDNEEGWQALSDRPGTHYIEIGDISAMLSHIKQLRSQVDIVIVSLHWGPNMRERPIRRFVDFAHALIDLGVDIIHGHSAHIFQGVERYGGGVILYDTGDFIDDYHVDPYLRNDRSFFFCVEVSKKGFERLTMVPTLIHNLQVNIAAGADRHASLERMSSLCKELNTPTEVQEGCLIIKKA